MRLEPFDTQRHMVFSRRATLFGGVVSLMFVGVSGRLYQLQVREYEDYRNLAEDNRFNQRVIIPLRGEIYDRFGVKLATNKQNFRVLLIPEEAESVVKSIAQVEQFIPLTEAQERRILRQAKRNSAFTPIEIAGNLPWDDFAKLNFKAPSLPGLRAEVGETRDYPFGEAAAFISGYVGAPSDRDFDQQSDEKTKLLFRQPGFRLGIQGLERTYDEKLRGQAGSKTVQVNAHGRVIEEYPNKEDEPVQGSSLGLTIDAELQVEAMRILAEPWDRIPEDEKDKPVSGAAVVMDVLTGDILIFASTPAFDPNDLNVGVSTDGWNDLKNSPYKPLLNKPINATYPPGSTFKMLTALTALEKGANAERRIRCTGKIWGGDRFYNCWKTKGHGNLDMVDSVKHSCDVYYWALAQQMEIDDLAAMARKFGLGQTYDLGLGTQQEGTIPDRAWKKRYYRSTPAQQTWFPGETLSVAIGQGSVKTTPLQLAVMTARFATGKAVMPRMVRSEGDLIQPVEAPADLGVPKEHLDIIRQGMFEVCNAPGGTATRSALPSELGTKVSGKTGTSQVTALQYDEKGKRIPNEKLPWNRRDHALFVSYAPYDNPRYACAVVVEHGSSGSRAAGPKARDIMAKVIEKNPAAMAAWSPGMGPVSQMPKSAADKTSGEG